MLADIPRELTDCRPCQTRLPAGHQQAVHARRPHRCEEADRRRIAHHTTAGPQPVSTPFSPCTGRRWASRTRPGNHRKPSPGTSYPTSLPRGRRPGRSLSPPETPAAPPKPWPPRRPDTPSRRAPSWSSPTPTSAHCCWPAGSPKPGTWPSRLRQRGPICPRKRPTLTPAVVGRAALGAGRLDARVRCWNRWSSVVRRGRDQRMGIPLPDPLHDCAGHARFNR